jgi:hypothetical protein
MAAGIDTLLDHFAFLQLIDPHRIHTLKIALKLE